MMNRKVICFFGAILLFLSMSLAATISFAIFENHDDGMEVNQCVWYESGDGSSVNLLGRLMNDRLETGFRFHLPELEQGQTIACARVKFPSNGGRISSCANLVFEGVLQQSPSAFSIDDRPSQKLPKTRCTIEWNIEEAWLQGSKREPLWYRSPNLAPIINEVLALPGWGTGPEGKTLIITVRDASPENEENYISFSDYDRYETGYKGPVMLEVHETLYDSFRGKELLGRVTDSSAMVNLHPQLQVDVYIQYGTAPGEYGMATPVHWNCPAGHAVDLVLDGLVPNCRYYYLLNYRRSGGAQFEKGVERTFHTQRSKNSTFVFSLMADEHLQTMSQFPEDVEGKELYRQTLQNIADGSPDFFMSLGDFAHTEFLAGRDAANRMEATDRYLNQREYIDAIAHSVPFYLVVGNHEGEQAWYGELGNIDTLDYLSVRARKQTILNPQPDKFFMGSMEMMPFLGLRENYFAWHWGDALFVALDPYVCTTSKPHGEGGSKNGWDWTLGRGQYEWLHQVLKTSTARWKFVFIHHLVSTAVPPYYGRGGIEIAKHKVDGRPSFEWGGEDEDGVNIFNQMRPGWNHGPIHDLLVSAGVTLVAHGHDHFFAWQKLDDIVYLEVPQPSDKGYAYGFIGENLYKHGTFLPNSGHVEIQVSPDFVQVDYVRAYLPGDGVNGEIALSRIIE